MNDYIADWVRKNFPEHGDEDLVVEVQVTHSSGDIEILRDTVYVEVFDNTHHNVVWTHDQWEVPKKFIVLNIARIEDMIFPKQITP